MKNVTVGILVVAVGIFAYLLWESFSFVFAPAESTGSSIVEFEVPPGSSFTKVASELESEGLIKDAFRLKVLAKLMGFTSQVRVGEYDLSSNMTPLEILRIISSGKSKNRPFTVVEGANMFEIAETLSAAGYGSEEEFLKLFKDRSYIESRLGEKLESLEGYLFPETYYATKYSSAEQIRDILVDRFLAVWKEIDSSSSAFTRHQIVTLASMVEKETGAPEERPVIASVFHNRLNKGMRLQSDPTILYGLLVETGNMKNNIRRADIKKATPYNTYTVNGLPKGPIANPGKEALEAAISPYFSEFLYFVSRNDGTHVFTKTYKEHAKAVREFQLNRKAREGKSWRDLNKRKEAGASRTDIKN